jgi:hypothetical protein
MNTARSFLLVGYELYPIPSSTNFCGRDSFSLEIELRSIIENNLSRVFPNLRFIKAEFRLCGARTRIDILAIDDDGIPYIIELKKSSESGRAISQLTAYIQELQDDHVAQQKFTETTIQKFGYKLASKVDFTKTKGIIIAHQFSGPIFDSAKYNNITLVRYEFDKNTNYLVFRYGEYQSRKAKVLLNYRRRFFRNGATRIPVSVVNTTTQCSLQVPKHLSRFLPKDDYTAVHINFNGQTETGNHKRTHALTKSGAHYEKNPINLDRHRQALARTFPKSVSYESNTIFIVEKTPMTLTLEIR